MGEYVPDLEPGDLIRFRWDGNVDIVRRIHR